MTSPKSKRSGLIGVGYQGRTLPDFVDEMRRLGVAHLVDVRLNPVSRKAGFGKSALSQALQAAGITYRHLPELGNPKANRAGFSGGPAELARARETYALGLSQPQAVKAIGELVDLAREQVVVVMCFEADQARCHRDVVLAEVNRRLST